MTPEEAHRESGSGAGEPRRAGTGPRHAAPRKPLLTRLHVPAGKAIALAAMPSAVLMGMGLTPRLATAEPLPKNPFRDGPCVTAPDRGAEEDTGAAAGGEEKPAGTAKPEVPAAPAPAPTTPAPTAPAPAPEPGAGAPEEPSEGAGTGGTGAGRTAPGPGSGQEPPGGVAGGGSGGAAESGPAPSETGDRLDRLDPLGIGGALKDLFTPGGGQEERTGGQEPADASATPGPAPSATGGGQEPEAEEPGGTAGRTTEEARKGLEKAGEGLEKVGESLGGTGAADRTPRDTAGGAERTAGGPGAGDAAEESGEPETGATAPGAGGREPYPCPTHDAEALENAEEERTEALLPDEPWRLETSLLVLHGLDYHGIVKVRTHGGKVKDVLKFTAETVDIRDLHQIVEGPGGSTAHVEAARGSTSTIRKGTVTMYTEELKGHLFGLIPVTFSPQSPPPLNIPEVFFTQVSVVQAGQFGGELHIPGMHLYNEG